MRILMNDYHNFFKEDPWSQIPDICYPDARRLYLKDDRFWVSKNENGELLFFLHECQLIDIKALVNISGVEIKISQFQQDATRLICTLISPEEDLRSKFSIVAKDIAFHCEKYNGAQLFLEAQELIKSWAAFLKPARTGLKHSEFVGFWGELYAVSQFVMKAHTPHDAVRFWIGPEGKKQDLTLNSLSVDVKTSLSGDPQTLKISSLDQLDKVTETLCLMRLVATPSIGSTGFSLSDLYAQCEKILSHNETSRTLFYKKTASLYGKASDAQLEDKYAISLVEIYEVREEFPSITRADISSSIVNLNYEISIAAINQFKMDTDILEKLKNG
jgi:hypothetical protein